MLPRQRGFCHFGRLSAVGGSGRLNLDLKSLADVKQLLLVSFTQINSKIVRLIDDCERGSSKALKSYKSTTRTLFFTRV